VQNVHPDTAELARLLDAVARGGLVSGVEATYPLDRAGEAHARQALGGLRGRIVLVP